METYMLTVELVFILVGLAALWAYRRIWGVREIDIRIDHGYSPGAITARQGEPLRLRLFRERDSSCTREIVFPSLNIRRTLPVGRTVTVDLVPRAPGLIEFFCGMNMLRGTVEVRPQI